MIKFSAGTPDGPLYGFGLTRANINALVAGEAIKISLADLLGPEVFIVLLFGEDERALFKELQDAGLVSSALEYRAPTPDETIVIRETGGGSDGTV
jgi:hypothetical protein